VTKAVPTIFMGALNGGSYTLTAQAVALITPCVYLTGTGSLSTYSLVVANGSFVGNSCPVYVNTGMEVAAAGQMANNATNVAGPPGSSQIAGFMYPGPVYYSDTMTDPLASLTQPSFSGSCAHTSYSVTSGSVTLSPGNYCKGLNISNATVTLNPGLYVITGGAT
jgi:hypothetical protein